MPMYDMYCKGCGYEENDVLLKSSEAEIQCPQCNEETLTKKIGASQFKFKNAGLQKHLKKYGNSNQAGVPNGKDNGVRLYGNKKSS